MNPKDVVTVKRGPLSGMKVELKRHDNANRCWHACINDEHRESVMVWDYELVDVVERKKKGGK